MRESIEAFVDSAAGAFRLKGPVYRFGSSSNGGFDVETSLRWCFPEGAYIDFELGEGIEIDRLPFPDGAARTVLCIGVLEHAFEPPKALEEMLRILSPGGALLVCAPIEDPLPDRMPAYWQLTPRSVQRLLAGMETTLVGWQGAETFPHTIYGIGFKPPLSSRVLEETGWFLNRFQSRLDAAARRIGWRPRLTDFLTRWARSRSKCRHRRDYYKVQFAVHLAVDQSPTHALLKGCLGEAKTGTRLDLMD